MGIDLVAVIYRGLLSYSYILQENGQHQQAALYKKRAGAYQQHIDRYWWDDKECTGGIKLATCLFYTISYLHGIIYHP